MNILFISAVLPFPLHSGGQIRMYNLMKRLSAKHRITLVSFIRDSSEINYIPSLNFCTSVHTIIRGRAWEPRYYLKAWISKFPFLLTTYENKSMRELLEKLCSTNHFDVVHAEPFYVLPSLPSVLGPLVISEHNIEYDVFAGYVKRFPIPFLRPFLSYDVFKLKTWERRAWRQATEVTAVSPEDESVIEHYLGHEISLVPNGVDLSLFPYRKPKKHNSPVLLFVGNFRWLPNREAAATLVDRIWPGVKKHIPTAKLVIAGRDIPSSLRNLVIKLGGKSLEKVEDIASVYRNADMLVAPHAISGGTKFKMLEAMSSGLPIITTKSGAGGLAMRAGEHYMRAELPQDFIARIQELWDNPSLAVRLSQNARRLVESEYDWDELAMKLERVWNKAYARG